jgi:3-deoxy-D-manno-octulosonic-acid transferase
LGEFEQGRPIIEKCKKEYPNHKILVTFFSPSGYEIRKDYALSDVVCYLPLDTKKNVRKFLELVHPEIAIFVKYEFWPNLLRELKRKEIKTILVSGIFRKEQSFFQWYGGWMRKSLHTFDHFFVQNDASKKLLQKIGFTNTTLSGDTRFDRVYDVTQQNIDFDFAAQFTDKITTLIAGSTWQKDEELLVNYINNEAIEYQKFIIAPHNIHQQNIKKLKQDISKKTILFSEIKDAKLEQYQVLIIDTIGMLTQIYKYGDIAYVGGGFGAGIHNILEPATFGVPVIIGPNYQKFNEAVALVDLKACKVINNVSELNTELNSLFNQASERENKGQIASDYILKNTGATQMIISYINEHIPKK